jgi:hypothetical protein
MDKTNRIRKKIKVKHRNSVKDKIANKTNWQNILLGIAVAVGILLGVYILVKYLD